MKLEHIKAYLKEQGIVLLEVPRTAGCIAPQLDLKKLFRQLGDRGIDSVLLEGGGTLNASALRQGLVQRVYAFVAPKLIAGADAKSPVEGTGISRMEDAVILQEMEVLRFGKDICITGKIEPETIEECELL